MSILSTQRLLLRQFTEADLDAYHEMVSDPHVMRFIGDGATMNRQQAWRSLVYFLGHWRVRGFGLWAVEEKETGKLVGRVGLNYPEGWPGLEVGWLLGRTSWGRGYATEAAQVALQYAFDTLKADHVISVIQPENTPSIRVAERLGETFERHDQVMGYEVLIYGVERSNIS